MKNTKTKRHAETLLAFEQLLKEYNLIYRDVASLHHKDHFDNDIEHSYRVALLCWMVIDAYKLTLNLKKVLMYALAHDFVEIYAGDVSIYDNTVSREAKAEREHHSFVKLKKNFPELTSLWKTIDVYEKRKDEESRFVYIIEKIEPILVVLLSEHDHFIKRKVSFKDFIERKQRKIKDIDNFARILSDDVLAHLKKHRHTFFKS